MIINSTKVIVNAKPEEIASFLEDAHNIEHLLPQDKIQDFKATTEECSFRVQQGVTISLIEDGREGNEKVFLKSGERAPFKFNLTIYLSEKDQGTEGYIEFDGQVNSFLKMMVEKPLTNLFNKNTPLVFKSGFII